jgi:hypothetical protein
VAVGLVAVGVVPVEVVAGPVGVVGVTQRGHGRGR